MYAERESGFWISSFRPGCCIFNDDARREPPCCCPSDSLILGVRLDVLAIPTDAEENAPVISDTDKRPTISAVKLYLVFLIFNPIVAFLLWFSFRKL